MTLWIVLGSIAYFIIACIVARVVYCNLDKGIDGKRDGLFAGFIGLGWALILCVFIIMLPIILVMIFSGIWKPWKKRKNP